MPLGRRRPLMRAAMVGGAAYAGGRHSQRRQQHEYDQDQQLASMQEQQYAQAPPPPVAPAPAPAPARDPIAQLKDLKGLLDSGVLTQAEFDAQKHKILAEA